jgi:adenylate cyclase
MSAEWGIGIALAGCLAWLAVAWLRARRRVERLGAQLDATTGELERLQRAFARFAPHRVVDEIAERGVSTQGKRREVTVLFADLVGFTPITERLDPGALVRLLNGYFERMSRVITHRQGHLSTLIGDGILALFGALEPNPWQANDAVHAALGMRAELAEYNRKLAAEGLPPLRVGVGLHRGIGVAGLVGSPELVQFTVVGSTVSVAARVQELTREHGVDVIVTHAVCEALDPRFVTRPLPPGVVRGIAEPLRIYSVAGFGTDAPGAGGASP